MDPVLKLDKDRTLRYTTRAMLLIEQRSGHTLGELLITKIGISSAVHLLWGALLANDDAFQRRQEPTFAIEDACELLDEHWFQKGKALKDLWPNFMAAALAAGFFTQSEAASGKDSPETGPGSPGSGVNEPDTPASVPGSDS